MNDSERVTPISYYCYINTIGIFRILKKLLSNLVLAGISLLQSNLWRFLGLQTPKQ